jgi:acetylornithine deacetylase/succinyl-diaminopimelate desuccinylase-like protein
MNLLKDFIAIPTIANDKAANGAGLEFVLKMLNPIGFEVTIEGDSPYYQPVIIAKYSNPRSDKKLVIYGHYDVEKIKDSEKWDSPPFELVEKEKRYYGRGIADNKGILLTRILALQEMLDSKEELPNILWIIQGEEEVGSATTFEVIPKHIQDFGADYYVEETGVYKENCPVIFHLPKTEKLPVFLETLNEAIYDGTATFENRSLNKFSDCAFLNSIPEDGHYIGFGPNDSLSNIHRENESLNVDRLNQHKYVFRKFISWVNQHSE